MGVVVKFSDVVSPDAVTHGGKGANLIKMVAAGYPVPPGVVIPTETCREYQSKGESALVPVFEEALLAYQEMEAAEEGQILVSVRSGAPISMPGMMDTILNVGMSDDTLDYWSKSIGRRSALDCYRRLVQMYGTVVNGISPEVFENPLSALQKLEGVETDSDISEEGMEKLLRNYLKLYKTKTKVDFPQSVYWQLRGAITAVFSSWGNERAILYRELNDIPHDMGTAVVIQRMVFGNRGGVSGSGVLFSRNPTTGEDKLMGEFLPNAQGEDVVAGVRTPLNIDQLPEVLGQDCYDALRSYAKALELTAKDMQDIEFTVECGKVWLLQTRDAKRTPLAAVQCAVDMYESGLIGREEVFRRVSKDSVIDASQRVVDPSFTNSPQAVGIGACCGVVSGRIAKTPKEAVELSKSGPVVLVRKETTPEDLAGMSAAVGVLTETGGATSHAAVVARALNTPCVSGAGSGIRRCLEEGAMTVTIDGASGRVWFDQPVPVIDGVNAKAIQKFTKLVFKITGCIEKTELPVAGCGAQVVEVASLLDNDPKAQAKKWKSFVRAVMRCKRKKSTVILDMTPPMVRWSPDDERVVGMFGNTGLKDAAAQYDALINDLVESASKIGPTLVLDISETPIVQREVAPVYGNWELLSSSLRGCGYTVSLVREYDARTSMAVLERFDNTGWGKE